MRAVAHSRCVGLFLSAVLLALAPDVKAQTGTGTSQASTQSMPPQPATFATTVTVIEAAPLPGVDLPIAKVPAPVQTATSDEIERSKALDLSSFLTRRFNAVFANEIQSNPFQPDINYRGYTASPLLGTPQGLSVYMDGVRLNQPFGDVVSWDLIPRLAISTATVMPGSNPLFGLNTLGGALAIQTKNGTTAPGTSVQAIYGSDVRRSIEFEHGGRKASGLNWYVAGICSRKTGGVPIRRRMSARSSGKSAGSNRRASSLSPSDTPTPHLTATAFRKSAFSTASTRASTRSLTRPRTVRRSST